MMSLGFSLPLFRRISELSHVTSFGMREIHKHEISSYNEKEKDGRKERQKSSHQKEEKLRSLLKGNQDELAG